MKTIRQDVFETNSSTTHCVTISKKYKCLSDIPLRDKSEFPKLNKNGELEIELNIFWDMEVREDPDIDLSSVDVIIKYLAAHAVFSSTSVKYSRKNNEYQSHFDENHKLFLEDLQKAYTAVGLKPPTDVKVYFLDINDNKIIVTKDNYGKWFDSEENPWYNTHKEWEHYVAKKIKHDPSAANWPYAKHHFGVCGNDLCGHSYESSTEYFDNSDYVYDWDERHELDMENITTHDLLTRQIELSFYHT